MTSTANPRHPFKAIVAFVAMAALVHGVFAHARPHHAGVSHVEIVTVHSSCTSEDCDWDDDDDPDVPDAVVVDADPDDR